MNGEEIENWNPHEYNLSLLESEWKWKVTIVLRTPFSKEHNRKLLNKDALKFVHEIASSFFEDAALDFNSVLGVCTSEKQESSGLLHHHLIFGDFWKPKLWFNDSKSKLLSDERDFRLKVVDFKDSLARDISKKLESTPFCSSYLGKTIELDRNPDVGIYIPQSVSEQNWIGYIVKDDKDAYWTPGYHKLVKRVNEINSRRGFIPDDLKHLKCWSKQRLDLDIEARLKKLLEEGGETK